MRARCAGAAIALAALAALLPDDAEVIENGQTRIVGVGELREGQLVLGA